MTTKTTKAYALFAMVPLLLAGFGGSAFASTQSTSYSADAVDDAFGALKPYVTVNDKQIAKIDVSKAKANGISNEAIEIGQDYIRIQNKMIQDIHDDPTKKMQISDEDSDKFKKFFDKIRHQGLKDRTIQTNFLESVIPLAYATHACDYDGPHDQPSTDFTGSYSSAQAGINDLPSSFDEVSWYASAFTYDYHDWILAYGCADGIFRYQTAIVGSGTDWEHRENHSPGEPNPEVLEYGWPVWWWGNYVYNWHN